MKMTGAEILIKELIKHEITTIFGYPGGYVLDIYDELYKNSGEIAHILTAGEQGAAFAADAYARVSGKTGVVIATGGPGATNLVTGIANSYRDSVPVVYITGNVAVAMLGQDAFQDIDIVGVTMPIVKHSYVVKDISVLQHTIREAFRIAGSGRKGPVHIDIPKDIQQAGCEYDENLALPPDMTTAQGIPGLALKLISESKRPFIYCGGGVSASMTGAEIMMLADMLDALVGMTLMGIGSVPASYKRNLGMGGMHGHYACLKAISEADLIIAAGVRFSDRATGSVNKFAGDTLVIHMDIDAAEIDKNIRADVSICGDIRHTLPALINKLRKLPPVSNSGWSKRTDELIAGQTCPEAVPPGVFSPKNIITAVNECYKDTPDICIATDVGQHQMWVGQYYKFEKPRTLVTSGGLGAMGYGLGAAIGASLARGGKRTVLFTGDGSFSMNMQELATAVSLRLPVTIILLNNRTLGMVRQWQTLFYDKRYSSTDLNNDTDYPALARSFGAAGHRAGSIDELKNILTGLPDSRPCLIECRIDTDEMVLPMLPPGAKDIIS